VGVDAEEAHHLMSNLDFPNAISEIDAAAAHLKAEGSPKVVPGTEKSARVVGCF